MLMSAKQKSLHLGHLGLILFCALLLTGITFMKGGFKLSFNKNTDTQITKYTLEQARQEVAGENGSVVNGDDTLSQLALIDPDLGQGSVLGASTEDLGMFPPAEEIFTSETLSVIKVKLLPDTNIESVKRYAQDIISVESQGGVLELISSINSSDPRILQSAPEKAAQIVAMLAQVKVPGELEEYHKLKMIYYIALGDVAANLDGTSENGAFDAAATGLFSLIDKLERIKLDVANKYGVEI